MSLLFDLQQVSVSFNGLRALKPCSLKISAGERVALLGANGSGKSTLLRALHGQQPIATGTRWADASARQVMVFQQPHMLRLSALHNVALALWLAGHRWQQAKELARQALMDAGFAVIMDRNARAMSVGQRQRLAMVRAKALQPDVLFLDEPTASLDPGARREVERMMAQFAQNNCSLIFASHNLGQVKRLASRVIYLQLGEVLVDMPTHAFFNENLPEAAALFLQGERV